MIRSIGFYLAVAILYPMSLLPYRVLYVISDLFFIVIYYFIGYRREVVRINLEHAFPDKSSSERKALEKRYYKYLCDLMVESVKLISVRMKTLEKRCTLSDMDIFKSYYKEGKSCILVLGHYGNWEMIGQVFQHHLQQKFIVLYRKMKNKAFENGITRMRTRHGASVIEANSVLREWAGLKDVPHATAFIADQSPPKDNSIEVEFIGKPVLTYNGVGKLAVRFSLPVVFIKIDRNKRGYYDLCAEIVSEPGDNLTAEQITQKHTDKLTEQIVQKPELWLWSHRRWKHHLKY